jgi:hypothetical protein
MPVGSAIEGVRVSIRRVNMRSPRFWKLLAVVMASALLVSFAVAGSASGKPGQSGSFTLVAISETADIPIERGFTWTDRFETTDGDAVDGWGGGRCINMSPDPEALSQWMCDMVIHLPQGDITATGSLDVLAIIAGDNVVFGVTGGTGQFRNARGELEVVPIPDSANALAVFRLLGASASF